MSVYKKVRSQNEHPIDPSVRFANSTANDNNKDLHIQDFSDLILDEERALYGIKNARITNCIFGGPNDGESALKESSNIEVINCDFRLRYPFWHVSNAIIRSSNMTESCRAALWYAKKVMIEHSELGGIKALRECEEISINDCHIVSDEFGWLSHDIHINNSKVESQYPLFNSENMLLENIQLSGKYSFQYTNNIEIRNANLDTKDAFWHSKDVTITDSIVKGEYLGWYSENLKFVRCKIIGTQPLCYAKGLVLEDCEMIDCDLSFEFSEVEADIKGSITSVKNPISGHITADSIEEIILDDSLPENANCLIRTRP